MNITLPRINSNGNPKQQLLDELNLVHVNLQDTIVALSNADYAHGRNYQTYPPGSFAAQQARHEHVERIQKLVQVREELQTIAWELSKQ
jgi:hypothetical protein